MQKHTKYGTLN